MSYENQKHHNKKNQKSVRCGKHTIYLKMIGFVKLMKTLMERLDTILTDIALLKLHPTKRTMTCANLGVNHL